MQRYQGETMLTTIRDNLATRLGFSIPYDRDDTYPFFADYFSSSRPPTGRAVADDYRDALSDTTAPFGTIAPGGQAAGSIETGGDRDVFAITLAAGQTYTFNLNRAASAGLVDPVLRLQNANGTLIASNDDFGGSRNSQITYTATTSGTFYLTTAGYQSGTGAYTLSATPRTPTSPADDFRDSLTDTTAPFGTLTVGTAANGRIETSGDADLFALSVTAGQTYTINLSAAASGGLANPVLRLVNGNGGQIAVNDDFGGGRNAQITYTATTTGTVYVEAKGVQTGTGNYTLAASSSAPPAPTDDFRDSLTDTTAPLGTLAVGAAASGRIETGGDSDLFAISLVAGQSYTFGLAPGTSGGLADPALRLLNGSGTQLAANNDFGGTPNAQISFTAQTSGTYYLEADGATATGTGTYSLSAANVTPPPPTAGAFDIQIRYTGDAAYQSLFDQAAARWEEVITADLPNFSSSRFGMIDDLLIDANVTAIDGRGGVLGSAGPDELRPMSAGGLPTHGTMRFDSADVASLDANGSFLGVILHEMGHVLGLGTLWERAGLTAGTNQYDGAAALAEYRVLTGNANETFIPLENDGGPGTAGGHWEEDIFRSELMTGFASGGLEMSRMTIASLDDLGYGVDLTAADPYTLPGRSNALALVQEDPIWGVM